MGYRFQLNPDFIVECDTAREAISVLRLFPGAGPSMRSFVQRKSNRARRVALGLTELGLTLEAAGLVMNLSRQRVHQLRASAWRRLARCHRLGNP
jgi:hypothetical protein